MHGRSSTVVDTEATVEMFAVVKLFFFLCVCRAKGNGLENGDELVILW